MMGAKGASAVNQGVTRINAIIMAGVGGGGNSTKQQNYSNHKEIVIPAAVSLISTTVIFFHMYEQCISHL